MKTDLHNEKRCAVLPTKYKYVNKLHTFKNE